MKLLRSAVAFVAALLVPALPARPPAPARPALWKLADKDTTIYLFGSIHVLPAGLQWRDAAIDKAMADSQSLTLEVVLDKDPESVSRYLLTQGVGKGLPPLAERVPANKRATLARLMAKSGVPANLLNSMKSWAAAVVLTSAAMGEIGLKPGEDGVEPQITRLFRDAGKPIDQLETVEQQLGFFDALPEKAQRTFLVSTLDDPKSARAEYASMVKAWSKGDVAAIQRAFSDEPEFTPELRDALVVRRDHNWAEALAKRMGTPGTSFVAVGAGHLTGTASVQAMLLAKGYKVVRVQ